MEERERLWRQIRLLQGLINDHKNTHGDAPRPLSSAPPRWSHPQQPPFPRRGAFSARYLQQAPRDFQPHQGHPWRKKYSLVNRPAVTAAAAAWEGAASATTSQALGSCGENQAPEPAESSPERHVDLTTDGNIVVGIQLPERAGSFGELEGFGAGGSCSGLSRVVAAAGDSASMQRSLSMGQQEERRPSLSVSFSSSHRLVSSAEDSVAQKPRRIHVAAEAPGVSLASWGGASAVVLKQEPQQQQQQHPLVFPDQQAARPLPRRRAEAPAPGQPSEQLRGAAGVAKLFGSGEMSSRPAPAAALVVGMTPSKSKFPPVSKAAVLQRSASASASSKSPRFRRTTYTWVANPGKCSRAGRRWGSPRASENVKRASGGADRAAKPPPKADVGAKLKKSTLQSKLGLSPSKYKWKASSLQTSPSTSKSAFRWQSEEQRKPPAGSLPRAGAVSLPAVPGGLGGAKACGDAMVSSYKVKSRTKIIKRKGSSSSPTEKRSSSSSSTPLKSHFQLRRKNSSRGKASTTPKRSSARGMVQVSKHRLCRLPATRVQVSTKEGASLQLLRSSPGHRVIQTRYRIVKRNVVAAASSSSCLPSWKPRRPLTSRSSPLAPTRVSSPGGKAQQGQQRWRSRGYRCIGGVLYRVSANKLSKTSTTPARGRDLSTKSPGRAGRLHCMASPGFSPSSCLTSRSTPSRSIASRAVQRSLAIIRQARQRRQRKEFCMYYNRFGKCNRGDTCPYIHDPEKVAVCTRFLRGTCKKTDGTCSFSHKVSKDKMPVCSYFLKGICSNSNCPYSHVYVSRKAEVCQDFLKGYCPRGEKCKKKHTLVCPDFAKRGVCPRGASCKLLHPQKRQHPREAEDGESIDHPSKWRRVLEETGRSDPAQLHQDGEAPGPSSMEQEVKFWKEANTSPSSWLQKLPSFISLQSPTSSSEQGCQVKKEEDELEDEPGGTKRKRTLPSASSQDSENTRLEEGGRGKQLQIKPRL